MRYLIAFLLIFISFSVNAQNRFPSVDSAKNYVLRFVKNSAVETFTNWRAQNVAYGTLELLDSLAGSGAVDSIWKNGDTLKYSKNGTTYIIGTSGQVIDTTSLSNRIDARVKYTDTAAMLSPYLRIANFTGSDTATVVKAYVTNAEAVTITKGQVVYIFGASGDRAAVKLAKNTSDTFSSKTLGIVRADIAAGAAGWVTTQGQVSGINLGAYTAGDILWLDSVAGGFTKTKPVAPYHSVFVGVVERANAGNGLIYVKPQNGQELGELHDTKITSPTNNQVLAYTSATDIWENKSVTTALGYTPLNVSDTAAMLNGRLSGITLNTSSAIHTTPVTFSRVGGAWSGTLSLANQSGFTVFRRASGTGTPSFGTIDSSYFGGLFKQQVGAAQSVGVQWQQVDSMFAKLSVENGYHHAEEFDVLPISVITTGTLHGTKYGFTAFGGGNYINTQDSSGVGIRLGTLTSSTSAPYINFGSINGNSFYLPMTNNDWFLWTCRIRIPTLNDGTERFYIKAGLTSVINITTPTNALMFAYDLNGSMTNAAASANFQTVSAASNVRTWNTTSITVTANQWYKLAILCKAGVAYYYIDNVLVQTHTTNIPIAGNNLMPYFDIRKTNGTTARTYDIDYSTIDIRYSTPR